MYALKNEHQHESIGERWAALDEYFVCITECDLNDQTCVTRCLVNHLKIDDGTDAVMTTNKQDQTLAVTSLNEGDFNWQRNDWLDPQKKADGNQELR